MESQSNSKPLTPRQERRKLRHEKNVLKDITTKQEAWDSGKIIEPNHNHKAYSPEYSEKLGKRLLGKLKKEKSKAIDNGNFLTEFRKIKKYYVAYILHYDHTRELSEDYHKIKNLLETYWDDPDNFINIKL